MWLYFPDRWINGISRHEKAVLLRSNTSRFFCCSGPLEGTCFQTFVNEQESIFFPDQPFDFSIAGTTEKEQVPRLKWIQGKLLFYKSRQPINSFPQICFPHKNVNVPELRAISIIEHVRPPQSPWKASLWKRIMGA